MKYPQQQYANLLQALTILSNWLDIDKINPSQLHYIVYQQYSDGQRHNWIYIDGTRLVKSHAVNSIDGLSKLLPNTVDFELYPKGCNDSHIETAMKRAIKETITL
jgi:hypothetical protein